MKTAISIPDQIFKAADELAHFLGISRSELFTKAIIEFLKKKNSDEITKKLDAVYSDEDSSLHETDYQLQIKSLGLPEDEW